MGSFLCGIDIGGTFTDCVVVDQAGRVTTAKALSTPPGFTDGVGEALTLAAQRLGLEVEELLADTALLSHGTTIGTNALIERRGATVGLITTKGHEDVIHIMRGSRGITGRDLDRLCHFPSSQKPDPIVPKRLIRGVSERVDCFGQEVAPLDEDEVVSAVRELVAAGVEAIAICFLWSFRDPSHELRAKELVLAEAPRLFVTTSSELVPKWGEYERTTAVALNAHLGPVVAGYLDRLDRMLSGGGYRRPMQITQCAGGTVSLERAMAAPLLTLDSGPVSGVTGSAYLGRLMGHDNIITTDMGGTSFDVGVIRDGEPAASYLSLVNQYEYFVPRVSIEAIGAGGGSIARVDELTGSLRVGPASAGAVPGPVCYGQGGVEPTVTDANLVLGRIDADRFAAGSLALDVEGATAALEALGRPLGMTAVEVAAGITRIVEHNMADLIRQVTIRKGYDPRDFVMYAFGGAGPLHAAEFAAALDVATVVVPQRESASVWCAFGAAAADILHLHERVEILPTPWTVERVNDILAALEDQGRARLAAEGVSDMWFDFSIDVRHRGQINEVEVPVAAPRPDRAALDRLADSFFDRYEQLYGHGAAFRGAALEAVTFRCRARSETAKPALTATEIAGPDDPAPESILGSRPVWWRTDDGPQPTAVFDGLALAPGAAMDGPALVETPDTTVVVPPTHRLRVDEYGNFELTERSP